MYTIIILHLYTINNLRFNSICVIECEAVGVFLKEAHESSGDTLQVLLLRAKLRHSPAKVLA